MRMVDIIVKKRCKEKLTKEEIEFVVKNYTNNLILIEENTVELEVKNIIKKSGYTPKNVEVIAENNNGNVAVKKIKVIIDGEVIIENEEHINITKQVENLLKNNCYNCELEVIVES